MNKKTFLHSLQAALLGLDSNEIDEIIRDYEEHFAAGMQEGRSEEDIASALGNPQDIAKQLRAAAAVKKAASEVSIGNIFRALVALLALGIFNLVIVLGPASALFGVWIAYNAAAIGFTLGGIGGIIASLFGHLPWAAISMPRLAAFFLCTGLTTLGSLMLIGGFYSSILLYKVIVAYFKFNIKIIRGNTN